MGANCMIQNFLKFVFSQTPPPPPQKKKKKKKKKWLWPSLKFRFGNPRQSWPFHSFFPQCFLPISKRITVFSSPDFNMLRGEILGRSCIVRHLSSTAWPIWTKLGRAGMRKFLKVLIL